MNVFIVFAALRGIAIGLFSPVWILYLYDQGYDLLVIGLFGTVFEIAKFLFEVPSGSFTDKKGVRPALLLSFGFSLLTWTVFPFIEVVWICLLVMIFWALSEALASGSFEAWMSLVLPEQEFGKALMRNTQVLIICTILASIVSGHLYRLHVFLPFLLAAALYAVMMAMVLRYAKPRAANHHLHVQAVAPSESFWQIFRNSLTLVLQYRRVLLVVVAGFFSALTYDVIARYWQPYLYDLGYAEEVLGYVMAAAGLAGLILLQVAIQAKKWIDRRTVLALTLVEGAGIVLMLFVAFSVKPLSILITPILLAIEDIRNPIVNSYLNRFSPDSYKATIFSINSGVGAVGEILSGVVFGLIAAQYGLPITFLVSALFLVPALILYRKAI